MTDYERGLHDAWKLARTLNEEYSKVRDRPTELCEWQKKYKVQSITELYEIPFDKVNTIHQRRGLEIGDEIEETTLFNPCCEKRIAVITALYSSGADVIDAEGKYHYACYDSVKKTGRRFSEVEELLKKMRGGKE